VHDLFLSSDPDTGEQQVTHPDPHVVRVELRHRNENRSAT
jgi:hypothetical protein